MIKSKAPTPIREVDYEAIEAALLQSARGRWFLAEYTKRNRGADTRMLLDAISRLETMILQPRDGSHESHMRRDLVEMAEAISQTRKEIAAMRSSEYDDNQFTTATEELDAIVEATEKATSDILEAAEEIQETAWILREKGTENEACDNLDSRATDIYTACSFQDLTGQRTGKIVETLRFLEKRVLAMIDIWGLDDIEVRVHRDDEDRPDAHLLNGPPLRGEGVDQAEVDMMIETQEAAGPVIDGEPVSESDTADEPVPAKPAAHSPAPVDPVAHAGPDASPASQPDLKGEVEASEFSAPPALEIDGMDETKKQVLFS